MGLENRDYARDGFNSDRGGWSSSNSQGEWEAWKKIIAVNVAVFLLQIVLTRPATIDDFQSRGYSENNFATATAGIVQDFGDLQHHEDVYDASAIENNLPFMPKISIVQDWCELDSSKVLSGQIWRLVTAGFCHDRSSIMHLLFNMLFLFWFGSRLEMRFGSAEFTAFYFASLVTASLAYMGLDLYTSKLVPAIGASGAVWGVVALYAMLYPYEKIYIYLLFPIQIRFLALIYFLFDLHPVLLSLSGEEVIAGVGHAAHIGGAIFGFLYWKCNWQLMPMIDRFRGSKRSQNNRWRNASSNEKKRSAKIIPMHGPYKAFPSDEEQRMDDILAKISAEGKDSLTAEEEQFLIDASKRLKQ